MFALLPETDPSLVQAYRYLARDESCRGLDGRLLAQLVYDTPTSRSLMARDLSSNSPCSATGSSTCSTAPRPATRRCSAASAPRRGSSTCSTAPPLDLDPELADLAELRTGPAKGAFPPITLQHATAALHSTEVILAVQGQRGLGKKLLLQIAAAHWNRNLLLIDGRRLAQLQLAGQALALRSLVRELKLLNAIPVLHDLDDATVQVGDRDELPGFFSALLDQWDGPVAVTINRERMPRIHQRPLVHLTLEVPSLTQRTAMWCEVVPTLAETDADSLSGRFAIPGGIIVAAAQAATAGRMPTPGRRRPRSWRARWRRSSTSGSRGSARSCPRRSIWTI